jgi:hypothetical protein
VAQSVEAVEFLSKHAQKNESESESEGESEGESDSEPSYRRTHEGAKKSRHSPVCLMLSGFIDGYVKHTIGSCVAAQGPPLHLIPEDLVTVEVACKSQGAECCEFVTAHIDHIAEVVKKEAAVVLDTDLETSSGLVGMLKIVRGRYKSGRGWLAHCLETSSSSSLSSSTSTKK